MKSLGKELNFESKIEEETLFFWLIYGKNQAISLSDLF